MKRLRAYIALCAAPMLWGCGSSIPKAAIVQPVVVQTVPPGTPDPPPAPDPLPPSTPSPVSMTITFNTGSTISLSLTPSTCDAPFIEGSPLNCYTATAAVQNEPINGFTLFPTPAFQFQEQANATTGNNSLAIALWNEQQADGGIMQFGLSGYTTDVYANWSGTWACTSCPMSDLEGTWTGVQQLTTPLSK